MNRMPEAEFSRLRTYGMVYSHLDNSGEVRVKGQVSDEN